jgi:hypothetical protein
MVIHWSPHSASICKTDPWSIEFDGDVPMSHSTRSLKNYQVPVDSIWFHYIILYHIISYYIHLYSNHLQLIYIYVYIYMEVPWNRATPQLSIYRCYFPWHIHHPMLATPVLRTASWSSGCWFVSLLGGMLCLASQGILDRERNPEMDGFHLVNLISGSPLVKLC